MLVEDKDIGDNGEVEYWLLYVVNVNLKFNVDLKIGFISIIFVLVGFFFIDKLFDFE